MRDKVHNCKKCKLYDNPFWNGDRFIGCNYNNLSMCKYEGLNCYYIKDMKDCPQEHTHEILPIEAHWINATKYKYNADINKSTESDKKIRFSMIELSGTCKINKKEVRQLFTSYGDNLHRIDKNVHVSPIIGTDDYNFEFICPICEDNTIKSIDRFKKYYLYMSKAEKMKDELDRMMCRVLEIETIIKLHDDCMNLSAFVNKKLKRKIYMYKRLIFKAITSLSYLDRKEKLKSSVWGKVSINWFDVVI
jgi:hypothetical protein